MYQAGDQSGGQDNTEPLVLGLARWSEIWKYKFPDGNTKFPVWLSAVGRRKLSRSWGLEKALNSLGGMDSGEEEG